MQFAGHDFYIFCKIQRKVQREIFNYWKKVNMICAGKRN